MHAPQSLRGSVMVKSPAGVLYRCPNLGIIIPIPRDALLTQTLAGQEWLGPVQTIDDVTDPYTGVPPLNLYPGPQFNDPPSPLPDITSTAGTDAAANYLTFIQDQRWNPSWRVCFLEIPSIYDGPPDSLTPHFPGKATTWLTQSEAVAYLGTPPKDTLSFNAVDTFTNFAVYDTTTLSPTDQAQLAASGFSPPWYSWAGTDESNEYGDSNVHPTDGPTWERVVTGLLPQINFLPGYAWFLWCVQNDLVFMDQTADGQATILLAVLKQSSPQPSPIQFWAAYGIPGPGGKEVDYWLAQQSMGKVGAVIDDTQSPTDVTNFTWRPLNAFGTQYLQPPPGS